MLTRCKFKCEEKTEQINGYEVVAKEVSVIKWMRVKDEQRIN